MTAPCAALFRAFLFLLCLHVVPLRAGSYVQNFSTGTVGTQTIGGGDTSVLSSTASTITTKVTFWEAGNKALQLMGTSGSNSASWKMPDLDAGKEIQAFDATFSTGTYRAFPAAVPGAGWSLNFGTIPTGNGAGEGGFAMAGGLVVAWDLFNNGSGDDPSIEVFCSGASVGNFPSATLSETPLTDGGAFTLTNPVSGGVTGPIAYNATEAGVQTAMRTVVGWEAVVVIGSAGGPWTVNHGVVGAYSDPVGDPTGIVPANSTMTVTKAAVGNATTNERWTIAQRAYRARAVVIHWDANGLDVMVNGAAIFTNLATPGFSPAIGSKFAFSARCESSSTMDFFLDDVVLTTQQLQSVETGGPVISEFMADNSGTLEDEDADSPDWIEIYNGQNVAVNLVGWRLTNVPGNHAMWTFPSVALAPYAYKIVYASGKNRTVATGQLHTNFTLQKESGYLALVKPDGVTIATQFNYGAQYEDVSYGERGPGRTLGYLQTATPGAKQETNAVQEAGGPAEDVVWSRTGGIITGATSVFITAPVAAGAVVRYTLNNSVPGPTSPIYAAPFNITSSTNLRARVFTPGLLPGPVSSRTFLLIDSSLTNYNGSGQVFSSNVPVIVFDSFGVGLDAENGAVRPDRYTYAVVIDKDPITGRASLTGLSDYQGRGGTHVHGESSAGFAQRSYNWETWNNDGQDKDVSMLGIPAGSDWVLHGPFSDKSAMRNHLVFSMMNEMRTDYLASRSRLVEVFFNQESGQSVSYSDYRGVYTLLEKVGRGANRVDIQKVNELTTDPAMLSGGYIFKHDKPDAGSTAWTTSSPFSIGMQSHEPGIYTTPQLNALSTYLNNFQSVLNGGTYADPVNGYAAWMDVSSFIDAQIAVEFTKQIDGYVFSTYWHKDRGGKLRAGPIWDFNIALGNANYAEGERATGWNYDAVGANSLGIGQLWYPRLHTDPWYRLQTFDRYWEWRRAVLSSPAFIARMDANVAALCDGGNSALVTANAATSIQSPAARHFRKYVTGYAGMGANLLGGDYWPNPPGFASRTTYKAEIDYLKTWMTTRLAWMDDQNFTGSVIYRPPNFSLDSGNVNSGTQLIISRYTGTPPGGFTYATGGTLYYTLNGTDPRNVADATQPVALISGNADACKWLVPAAENTGFTLTAGAGAQQWTTYTDPPNIANWTTGTTGVGYDTNPDYLPLFGTNANTGAQMNGINATCYLRVVFNIPNQTVLNNIAALNLSMKYDDGFRAYINGVAVAGRNDADPSMTADPSTAQANQIHDDSLAVVFEDIDITTDGKPALRVGTNVLAIHCLNLPSASSDLLMVPKLTYLPTGANPNGRYPYTSPIVLNSSTKVRARLFANNVWSPITNAEFVVNAVPASASNLVISEIMYNPSGATLAEANAGFGDNDFEYIELLNIGAVNVDLSGCEFINGVVFNFDAAAPLVRTLAPGERVLVVANQAAFAMRYAPGAVKIAGVFSGSLSNSGELITLNARNGAVIAEFTYDDDEPWPVSADGSGYSLVLNHPVEGINYGSPANWRSSMALGGTPGLANGLAFTGLMSGDTDGDGVGDFVEYATGSNWSSAGSRNLPTISIASFALNIGTDNYLKFQYRRNLAADAVSYTVQYSEDLVSWSSAPAAVTYVNTVNNGDGTAMVTCRSTLPVSPSMPKRYMRLMIAQ